MSTAPDLQPTTPDVSDEELVRRIRAGETWLFEHVMRRYNRRLYRVARAIVGLDSEAEDVMQDAYVRAFANLSQFEGRSRFATWLTRIAVHEALARARRGRRELSAEDGPQQESYAMHRELFDLDPERRIAARELGALLERIVESLPEGFRAVFVLRAVEELSVTETAECLEIPEQTVKTRLHRARKLLQRALAEQADVVAPGAFALHLSRCDRVVAAVSRRLALDGGRRACPPMSEGGHE